MASFNPSFNPNSIEKSWVDQISKTLQTQLAVTINTPPVSIFLVPKTLKEEKLEAYVPQRVGLGLNHHFQPELYHKIEQKKLTAARRVLLPHQIQDFEQEIVEKVKKIVPLIRDSYDLYHDADDNMLAWLFAIDGMFLIDQLNTYSDHGFAIEANDLIMLENQIPLVVLKEIQKALLGQDAHLQEDYLESKFRFFCNSNSTFVLSEHKVDFNQVHHLLDYMYNSIMNNERLITTKVELTNPASDPSENDTKLELLQVFIKFAGVIPVPEPFGQIIKFAMPKIQKIAEEKAIAEEIKVPSASELRKVANVEFRLAPENEGIRNINFVQGKARYCYLPLVTLNTDSETVLRNLVAYENLMAKNSFECGYGLELTEYVDFLCGIIDNANDVKLLREENIIQGDLGDEEIVKLFNGIGRTNMKMSVNSKVKKTVAQLNMVYEGTPRVRVRRMIEKRFRASAMFIAFLLFVAGVVFLVRMNPWHMVLVRLVRAKLDRVLLFVGLKGPIGIA
ncbi:hypothetical protein SSX86_002855 [Deinandra increscens subsp. villosa]|uniref:Uncharacterized protein n=1 Tax=Deinandra increscens subsp. villosa TaxID=3103831 RepID=A0AAP0DUA3_9ASTR